MRRSCRYCGRTHGEGEACPLRPRRKIYGDTAQRRLRSTNEWTKTSLKIRERDLFLCQICLERGKMTTEGVGVHHIIPLEEDDARAFDGAWLISLCPEHHREAEKGEISRERLHRIAFLREEGVPPGG